MKYLFSLLVLVMLSFSPVLAAEGPTEWMNLESLPSINKADHLSALVRTDREPRSWKRGFFLIPGKETYFYYEWVKADGTTVTKIEDHKLEHIPDRRPLSEAHPNLAIIIPLGGLIGSGFQVVTPFAL